MKKVEKEGAVMVKGIIDNESMKVGFNVKHNVSPGVKKPFVGRRILCHNDLFAKNASQNLLKPSRNLKYALTRESSKYRVC